MRLRGVLFEKLGKHGARIERAFDVPWDENAVIDLFGELHVESKDDQQLWAAGLYEEGASRGNAGLIANTAVTLDHDCADPGTMSRTVRSLKQQGLAFMVYTSWSHGNPDKTPNDLPCLKGPWDCYRVVIPLSRDVTPDEYRVLVPALFGAEVPEDPEHYAAEAARETVTMPSGRQRKAAPRGWDPCAARPSQAYYTPAPHAALELYQGRPLDVELILSRPTTARVTHRAQRPYTPATHSGLTALGRIHNALLRVGLGFGRPGFAGWVRSTCPACMDPSPSLTARANGDGVDLHCHAACKRTDILDALALNREDFLLPTDLKQAVEDQLARRTKLKELSVDEASARLAQDLREALATRAATVLKYPPGTGKSHVAAAVITEEVRAGYRIVYATQEHAVAHETRKKLPPDVFSRSVHIHSPLVQVGDEPRCQRAEELSERVFDFGMSLLGKVCPRCPLKDRCEALVAAKSRAASLDGASVIFTSHVGLQQIVAPDGRGADLKLIVDEMPGTFTEARVSLEELKALSDKTPMPSAEGLGALLAREYASAWLEQRPPGDIKAGTVSYGDATELLRDGGGRLKLRENARPRPEERPLLKAAANVLRIAHAHSEGVRVVGLDTLLDGVWTMIPDACHQALIDRGGVLLSATPLLQALPGFALRECDVKDGAPVRRVLVLRRRGSATLTHSYYDDEEGRRVLRDPRPGEDPGIPWPLVDAALSRAREEASRYDNPRVLFITFKAVADALRTRPERLGDDVVVAHYGALRGKNDWMEGRGQECSVVYCFGTPRFNMQPTLRALGLAAEALDQAWVDFAAGELCQAEGRLRLPRRKKPCSVVVEGDVAPSSWHAENVSEVWEAEDPETPSAKLEGALLYESIEQLQARIGGDVAAALEGGPTPDVPKASVSELIGRMSRMSAGRRRRMYEAFSWVDLGA